MRKLTIHPSVCLCDRHTVPTLLKSFRRFWNNSRTQIRHNEQVRSQYFKIVMQTFGPRTSTPWRQPFCLTDCRGRGGERVLGKCHLRSEIYLDLRSKSKCFCRSRFMFLCCFSRYLYVCFTWTIDWQSSSSLCPLLRSLALSLNVPQRGFMPIQLSEATVFFDETFEKIDTAPVHRWSDIRIPNKTVTNNFFYWVFM